jgi:DNA polymerase-3 subunit alpha
MNLVNLHNHSYASLLDGFSSPEEMARRTKELGQSAVALTDHGSLAASLKFYKACRAEGVKPLIGVEAYLTYDMSVKEKGTPTFHMGIIALNNDGLKKLFHISEVAWNKGFYRKPRIDLGFLKRIADGRESDLVVLTGCLDGMLLRSIRENQESPTPSELLDTLKKQFRFLYVEVQPWNDADLNKTLLDLANHSDTPVVVTADSHYSYPEHKLAAEVGLLMQQVPSMKKSDVERAQTLFN